MCPSGQFYFRFTNHSRLARNEFETFLLVALGLAVMLTLVPDLEPN
jgi:hypothetical protein